MPTCDDFLRKERIPCSVFVASAHRWKVLLLQLLWDGKIASVAVVVKGGAVTKRFELEEPLEKAMTRLVTSPKDDTVKPTVHVDALMVVGLFWLCDTEWLAVVAIN